MANEKRLIWDVDMKTAFREWFDHDDFRTMNQVIDDIPTVDAVEVVHAKWVLVGDGVGCCSNCHRLDYIDNLATHCRYCGAKMDGDGNG